MSQAIPIEIIRNQVGLLAVSIVVIAIGAAALFWYSLRGRKQDRSLLYFGIADALYGTRMLVNTDLFYAMYPGETLQRITWVITFVIGIPFVLFFVSMLARGWRKVAIWTIALQIAVGIFGICCLLLGRGMQLAMTANNVLVIAIMPLFILMAFLGARSSGRDLAVMRFGAVMLGLSSLYTNLAGLNLISGSAKFEPIGFLIFLGCLGYVSANRTIRNEESLVAIQKELDIARDIQTGLLPSQEITIPQLSFYARYVPASSVAGDFYDFLVDGDKLGVLVADVTGHGVPAALAASMVKVAIRSQQEHAAHPAEVLAGLNSVLHGNLKGQFVTAGYVYLDPVERKLTYAGAGHPPMLLWRAAQKKVETVEENGLFLGPFPFAQYSEKQAPFEPGDRCMLYTDGVLEAPGPSNDEFGIERLQQVVAENATATPKETCDAVLAELQAWCGSKGLQHDDITVIVVSC